MLVDSLASGGARPQERAEAAKLYGSEAAAAMAGAAATFEPDEELAEVGEGLRARTALRARAARQHRASRPPGARGSS